MRFSELLAASLAAPLAVAHSGIPGVPKIWGLPTKDLGRLKSRSIYGGHAEHAVVQGPQLHARQGGNSEGRCGPSGGGASCATGFCCSGSGYCGQGSEYCAAPDGLYEYGPANDANVLPSGGTTRQINRPKSGSVLYGGAGVWVCEKPGTVAITYDDGPYIYTSSVLNLFKAYNFQATFFVTGINIGKGSIDDESKPWPGMLRKMITDGHQIASHTWSHQDLSTLTKEGRYEQMIRLEMALYNVIGKFPAYMRPPYSSCTPGSGCEQDMADLGYVVSYFDLDTDDYNNITPDKIQNAKNNFKNALAPSSATTDEFLAIAHDIHDQTANNLTVYMLDQMVAKGYRGVTMGECLNEPEANWYRTGARVATSSVFTPPGTRTSSATSRAPSATPTSSGIVSQDGSCGGTLGYTCVGFSEGECCSEYGWCGTTTDHCGATCNPLFGKCTSSSSSSSVRASSTGSASRSSSVSSTRAASSSSVRASSTVSSAPSPTPSGVVSQDGSCGGTLGYTCVGFSEGECCSQYGWCGSSTDHCGATCNPLFGKCTNSASSSTRAASSSAAASSSVRSSSSTRPASSSAAASSSVRSSSSSTRAASSTPAVSSSVRPSSSSVRPSSTVPSSTPSGVTSTDGSCGGTKGFTCTGFSEGECCSTYGWCGSSTGHCGTGCNPLFGKCTNSVAGSSSARVSSSTRASSSVRASSTLVSSVRISSSVRPSSTRASSSSVRASSTRTSAAAPSSTKVKSTDATCGGTKGFTCLGFSGGECCSQYGWCGSATGHCGTGCQAAFGKCT